MKKIAPAGCLGIAAIVLTTLFPKPALAQSYYPMVCRTGGDMSGAIPASGVAGVPSGQTRINIYFSKAAVTYSGSLRPGECSWLDRPVNASEPDNVRFNLNTRLRVTFGNTDRDALVFDSVGTAAGTQVNTIMETLMDGDYFWFEVRNANAERFNYFEARNFRVGRPASGSASIR